MMVRFAFILSLILSGILPNWSFAQVSALKEVSFMLRAMSFNIRYDNPDDGDNRWQLRKDKVAALIHHHEPLIIGMQEALLTQIQDLEAALPEYAWIGKGRDDGETSGEFMPIFFHTGTFLLEKEGHFWLSDTPDQPGSRGWDAACNRMVTWGRFVDLRARQAFYVFNTHFDHKGTRAQLESAKLLLERIPEIVEDESPVLLMGDLNVTPDSEAYQLLEGAEWLMDTRLTSQRPAYGPDSTWSGFEQAGIDNKRIDYIFVNAGWRVHGQSHLSDSWSGRFPSDHLPVLAVLFYK